MIETLMQWAGNILMLLGSFFVLTGAVGLLRMPDFFTRLHPAGVTDSLGAPCILVGLMLHSGFSLVSAKLLLLLLFLLLTTPTACHAVAKAAMLTGVESLAKEENPEDAPKKLKKKPHSGQAKTRKRKDKR